MTTSNKTNKGYKKNRELRQNNPNIKKIVDGEVVSFHRPQKEVDAERKAWEKEQKIKNDAKQKAKAEEQKAREQKAKERKATSEARCKAQVKEQNAGNAVMRKVEKNAKK